MKKFKDKSMKHTYDVIILEVINRMKNQIKEYMVTDYLVIEHKKYKILKVKKMI